MMHKINKGISVLLVISMLALCLCACASDKTNETDYVREESTFVQPVFTEAPSSVKKTEVVYVNMDGSGAFNSATVSDWLHTDRPNVKVADTSTLTDIFNVKSEILPVYDGDTIYWNMDSTDLYYSGTTSDKPPVDISIRYFLDGVEYSAADIAGKSGTITMQIAMTNNKTATIKDPDTGEALFNVSLPILVAGGAIFPGDTFSSVSSTGATLLGDGSKQVAVVVGLPGFASSLGLDSMDFEELNDLKMTGSASITVTTESFSLGNMYFAMFPLCSMDLGLVIPESLSALTTDFDSLSSLVSVVTSLDLDSLSGLLNSLAGNMDQLLDMADLLAEAVTVYNENKVLLDLLNQYMTPENITTLTNLANSVDADTIDKITALASNPIVSALLSEDVRSAITALSAAAPMLKELLTAMEDPAVQTALNNLPETMETLGKVSTAVNENEELLNSASELLSSGALTSIEDLTESLDGTDLSQLLSKYEQLIGNVDGLAEKAKFWIQFGESYKIFTAALPDYDTSVTFICKTASVE